MWVQKEKGCFYEIQTICLGKTEWVIKNDRDRGKRLGRKVESFGFHGLWKFCIFRGGDTRRSKELEPTEQDVVNQVSNISFVVYKCLDKSLNYYALWFILLLEFLTIPTSCLIEATNIVKILKFIKEYFI